MIDSTLQPVLETSYDDERLVTAARQNRAAFAQLYDRYLPQVYRYLFSRVGNSQDAEDLTAQVFLTALERFSKFQGQGTFAAWLFTIARNKSIDFFRSRRIHAILDENDLNLGENDNAAYAYEETEEVLSVIRLLPEDDREVLYLRFAAQMTFADIARVLNRSEEAVKKHTYRLLGRIEAQMEANHA
jgi:RNA polymerase sigma-70 factor (ECF subfamily)